MTRDLVLWGGTGHARVLHEAIMGGPLRIVAIFDERDIQTPIRGVPIYRGEASLRDWLSSRKRNGSGPATFTIAIGGTHGRDRLVIFERLCKAGLAPTTIIHSAAWVARDAVIGCGSQVLAGARIGTHTRIGRCVIVNTGAQVDHDGCIEDGAHLGPGAILAGEVLVETCSFVGTGAIILPRRRIGSDAIVGAGAVVVRDVEPSTTVSGIPARVQVPVVNPKM